MKSLEEVIKFIKDQKKSLNKSLELKRLVFLALMPGENKPKKAIWIFL